MWFWFYYVLFEPYVLVMVWKFSVIIGEGNWVVKAPFCIPLKLVLLLPEATKRYESIGEDHIRKPIFSFPHSPNNAESVFQLNLLERYIRERVGVFSTPVISIGGIKLKLPLKNP
jgi:hypothetical protein